MKSALIAAAALVGSAQAGVHKMKLQKVSLEQQLVRQAQLAVNELAQARA